MIVNTPAFEGLEKHLLKAQLVRIDSACEICLKDFYRVKKEDEDLPINY